MRIQPFQLDELQFAWCNRVFLRSRTHLRKPVPDLAKLTLEILADRLKPYDVHVLEFATDSIEFRVLLSLQLTESVSAAVSKTKGRISKWLHEQEPSQQQHVRSLARGHFAVTTGQSTANAVDAYLDKQSKHHGYADRVQPPVFVQSFEQTDETRQLLQTDHAVTLLRYHLVLSTWFRRGLFNPTSAEAVTNGWNRLQRECGFLLEKVSFVPDHVHLALSIHPTRSPAEVVVALMNSSQETMWNFFENDAVRSGVVRLWQSSAYMGSFGDISSNAVSSYMKRWSGLSD